jgi:hypothetical protein
VDGSDACIASIERAVTVASSPLARAMRDLAALCGGRGTCLLIEHEEMGETLIADRRWTLSREETLRRRDRFAIVDLRQESGLRRITVLVELPGAQDRLDEHGLRLTLAALQVTRVLADMAASFDAAGGTVMDLGRVQAGGCVVRPAAAGWVR